MMFLGTFPLKLDDKGRLFLPAKWRQGLAEGAVIVQGHDGCLAVYPSADFEKTVQRVVEQPDSLEEVRAYQRMMAADATETFPDKQGRVSVPASLREYAHLDKDIVVTGSLKHGEIWDADTWDAYKKAHNEGYSKINKMIGQEDQ